MPGPLFPHPPFYTGDKFDLPAWAKVGVCFALAGRAYRIVGTGCHNNTSRHCQDMPMVNYVTCEPLEARGEWRLPDAPCPVADVAESLRTYGMMPTFTPDVLEHAIRLAI